MSQIEVPDWVTKVAEDARVHCMNAVTAYGSAGVDERYHMAMRAALTAALSAWVVPKPIDWQPSGRKRVFIPDAPVVQIGAPLAMTGRWETSYYWRAELGGKTTNGSPPTEALYTLRQEKPE